MNITLKGNVVREFETGSTVQEIAKQIGAGLYKSACAGKIGDKVIDLRTPIYEDCELSILTFDDQEGKLAFWHTTSHILAQAVLRLYPNVKYAIGPAIESGFYYDFEVEKPFTGDDLIKIEKEMQQIVKSGFEITRFEADKEKSKEIMKEQPYKLELIDKHSQTGEDLSFYQQGEFVDLCAGPHLSTTAGIKAIKLLNATGAYWHGNSDNAMLCRIYGISFPKASMLEAHITMLEDAKKRDHNKIGRELEYFTTVDVVGQGLPILMPKGAKVIQLLQRFVEDEEEKRGYQITKTPLMAKSDLYKISGHWDHYKDGMFILGNEETDKEVYALRPMTCPFQYQVYLNRMRSYRDLPMRLAETSTLFRNEDSGEMHGLIRLRQFTISEGHLIVRPDQLEEEFKGALELANKMLEVIGLSDDVSYRFSQWDPNNTNKYEGTAEQWETAQATMAKILEHLNIDYSIGIDEAAFYGPKLDVQIKNVYGKEDTLITIQIDMLLAARFGMEYVDKDSSKSTPYIIHRTSIGCYERTLALILEKYAGALPTWLMPTQVKVLPITDRSLEFCGEIMNKLQNANIRCELDDRSEKIGYKIREAQLEKIPYMLVVGDKEVENKTVAVRSRKDGDIGVMNTDDFISKIVTEIVTKALS